MDSKSLPTARFFEHRHAAVISYEITLLNADAPIVISSALVYQQETWPVGGDL
jgi:hypothetical protein